MSKESQISNLGGLWSRIKTKMNAADANTLQAAKDYADAKAATLNTLEQVVLSELPASGEAKKLYFVPSANASENNVYDEFIWVAAQGTEGQSGYVAAHFEQVGSTAYTPTHDASYNSASDKVAITIGGTTYLVPYISAPSTPVLKHGNDTMADNATVQGTKSFSLVSDTAGAEIRYTTDGSTPTSSSTKYTQAFSLAQDNSQEYKSYTVKAIAYVNGVASSIMSITLKVYRVAATPTFGVSAGTYNATQSVSLTCATDSAAIYYTTDGSTPVPSEADQQGKATKTYSSAIAVNVTTTIKALSVKSNWVNSPVTTATYTLAVSAPSISASGGQYDTSRTITINKPSNATKLYYKKTGDSGWSETTDASASITLSTAGTYTIDAKGTKDGWNDGTATHNVTVGTLYTHAGLSAASAASNVVLGDLTILEAGGNKKASPVGNYTFTNNSGSAKYIWFAVPSTQSITSVMVGATPQDVEAPQTIGPYKFYRMTGDITNGNSITLTVQ